MILSDKDPGYRQCTATVMDNIADPDITFDDQGISNYYYLYKSIAAENLLADIRPVPGKQVVLEGRDSVCNLLRGLLRTLLAAVRATCHK